MNNTLQIVDTDDNSDLGNDAEFLNSSPYLVTPVLDADETESIQDKMEQVPSNNKGKRKLLAMHFLEDLKLMRSLELDLIPA